MPFKKKPVIGMKIASTAELSDKGVITYIQAENNNKTGQGEISNQIIKKD